MSDRKCFRHLLSSTKNLRLKPFVFVVWCFGVLFFNVPLIVSKDVVLVVKIVESFCRRSYRRDGSEVYENPRMFRLPLDYYKRKWALEDAWNRELLSLVWALFRLFCSKRHVMLPRMFDSL